MNIRALFSTAVSLLLLYLVVGCAYWLSFLVMDLIDGGSTLISFYEFAWLSFGSSLMASLSGFRHILLLYTLFLPFDEQEEDEDDDDDSPDPSNPPPSGGFLFQCTRWSRL